MKHFLLIHFLALGLLLAKISVGAEPAMDPPLRLKVDALKAAIATEPTTAANARDRALLLYEWINAHALSGGYVPVNATAAVQTTMAYGRPTYRQLDEIINELALRDE